MSASRRSRRPAVLALALLVTALAAFPASWLRIDAALLELLPDLPAAADYREFVRRFGGVERLWVAVGSESGGHDALELAAEAGCRLAELVAASPLVRSARCGLDDRDESFWLEAVAPRALLLMDDERLGPALERLSPTTLRSRFSELRSRLAGPMSLLESDLLRADPLEWSADLSSVPDGLGYDPLLNAFVSRSGRRVLVVITPGAPDIDAQAGHRLAALLDGAAAQVQAELGRSLEFRSLGGPLYAAHDEGLIRMDVIRTAAGSTVAVTLLLVMYFGSLTLPLALSASMACAVIWTAALVALVQGRISVIGISFAAILVGLGVDYGIHAASRYREGLLAGTAPEPAMSRALRSTGRAIVASVATTAAAFGVLSLSRLGAVRELGWLVACGIVAVLVASLTVGVSLAVLGGRPRAGRGSVLWRGVRRVVEGMTRFAAAHRRATLAAATLVTLAAVVGAARVEFSTDLRKMRPHSPALASNERLFIEEFALGLDALHVIVEAPDLGQALEIAAALKRRLVQSLGDQAVVHSPSDLLLGGSLLERRSRRVQERLDPASVDRIRGALRERGFAVQAFAPALDVLDALAAGDTPPEIPRESWPDWISALVHSEPGATFVGLRVEPRTGLWRDGVPDSWVTAVRQAVPTAAIASVGRVGQELRSAVAGEFRRLMGWSLAAVGTVVLLSFRGRLRPALLALVPVAAGSLWLIGLYGALQVPIGLFAVTVIPVLVGIGIDDGLHALHGARSHGGLVPSILRAGPAMAATTLTTSAGFGSLMLSRVPALRQAGLVVALGTLSCLLASLVLLPALAGLFPGLAGTEDRP